MITVHTDVVGSLIRPSELVVTQKDLASGRINPA